MKTENTQPDLALACSFNAGYDRARNEVRQFMMNKQAEIEVEWSNETMAGQVLSRINDWIGPHEQYPQQTTTPGDARKAFESWQAEQLAGEGVYPSDAFLAGVAWSTQLAETNGKALENMRVALADKQTEMDDRLDEAAKALAQDRELLEIARSSIELLRGQLADAKQALADMTEAEGIQCRSANEQTMLKREAEAALAQSKAREASLAVALSDFLPIVLNSPKDHASRIFTCAQQALARHHAATQEGKQ